MKFIYLSFYNLSIRFYRVVIFLASFFNEKAKRWIDGRKNWKDRLNKVKRNGGKRIWFHCASLGEFEQARPLIEKIKVEKPYCTIVLTFFSPSGFEIQKKYQHADLVLYLPLDTKENAVDFINSIKPDLALFTKYDFWYHYLTELNQQNIPVVLFSALFRKEQVFFKWYGSLFREMLATFSKIFVQNDESNRLLKSINIDSEVASDTRFDRVIQISQQRKPFPLMERFRGDSKIFIGGSTWRKDEKAIIGLINKKVLSGYKYIIVPHEIVPSQIESLIKNIRANTKIFSELTEANAPAIDVVIVDSTGSLSSLYAYADMAYIGGGFDKGVHNILEAAVYGLPVFFGRKYKKSLEAKEMIDMLCAVTIYHPFYLEEAVKIFESNQLPVPIIKEKASKYVHERAGGTEKIYNYIKEKI